MNCDNCKHYHKHYHWYYDYCDKWDCEMDARACNSCFEARETDSEKWYMVCELYHAKINKEDIVCPCCHGIIQWGWLRP